MNHLLQRCLRLLMKTFFKICLCIGFFVCQVAKTNQCTSRFSLSFCITAQARKVKWFNVIHTFIIKSRLLGQPLLYQHLVWITWVQVQKPPLAAAAVCVRTVTLVCKNLLSERLTDFKKSVLLSRLSAPLIYTCNCRANSKLLEWLWTMPL